MDIRRRHLLQLTAWAAAAHALPAPAFGAAPRRADAADDAGPRAPLRWLDGAAPASFAGAAWGTPWPQGLVARDAAFALRTDAGGDVPVQSWPLAFWPDGSLKWSGHALGPDAPVAGAYTLVPAQAPTPATPGAGMVTADAAGWSVDTGALQCRIPRTGPFVFATLARRGQTRLADAELVVLTDDGADDEAAAPARRRYRSDLATAVVEQDGPVRAVMKLTGTHRHADRTALLPFTLRLYFYRGSSAVRILHTLVYDADPGKTFVRGIGLRARVALAGAPHDRHVRFVGADGGVFAESVRGLTGLRRDAGTLADDQHAGRPLPPVDTWPAPIAQGLAHIPAFGSWRLLQADSRGYTIAKRTGPGHAWVHAADGMRAAGTGYLGDAGGGVAFGVRHFWQGGPGQLDIDGADRDNARITLWLWSPQAPAMDVRTYHDGLGQDTFQAQRAGLDITYEDYEPGFGTPVGVARTSELGLQLLDATPAVQALVDIARRIETPPRPVPPPQVLHAAGVFSPFWAPAAGPRADARTRKLERQLDDLFAFYRDEVDRRGWYGYWDYGDVMHTYDPRRHAWRYDVGGFAWDNTELSTEVWLWHYFLHSGRADAFRLAEAMTRHTSEVDVYHLGPFAPLGTRHGVQHWSDSAKQLRISTALNRRFLYYLAADERLGDLLDEQVEGVRRLRDVVPGRKIGQKAADDPHEASVNFGTDWGAVAAAWFTAWERTGDARHRDRLLRSMAGIAAQPHGFFTGVAMMDLDTGAFARSPDTKLSVSHLSAVFGLTEICAELIANLPQPDFRAAWLAYCRLYDATPDEQRAALGQPLGKLNLRQGHARLLAYAAAQARDPALMAGAWQRFDAGNEGLKDADFAQRKVLKPEVLNDVTEAPRLSTNAAAQWGLGALGMLALDPLARPPAPVLVRDDFRTFDPRHWRVEAEADAPAAAARAAGGALLLDATAGLTVWLEQPLFGHYEIAFTRTVLDEGRPHDRVSDLNMFWEAQRGAARYSGKLETYDRTPMFYAGIGGNGNTTTRFRRHDGSGARVLLGEYLQAPWLLRANHPYRVRIVVDGAGTRLYVDNVLYFAAAGRIAPSGWFGLRTTKSRQRVEDFTVFRLA